MSASKISATSEGICNKIGEEENNNKVIQMKEKEVESEQDKAPNSSSHNLLEFVNLSKEDSVRGSNLKEIDFFSPGNNSMVGSSSCWANNNNNNNNNHKESREEKTEEKTSESRTLSCDFCIRKFSSPQALGGHQNAHKHERAAVAKRYQENYNVGAFGHSHFPRYPYPSISTPPCYGSYNKALGVRMESMIHKPSHLQTPPCFRFGHGHSAMWSPLQEMLNASSSIDRLRMESWNANSGIRILANVSSATSKTEEDRGNVGAILQLGDSSTNVATHSNSGKDKGKSIMPTTTGDHHSNNEEPSDSDSSGLDLSLKL